MIKKPEVAAKQEVSNEAHHTITTQNGKTIPCKVDTLCVHGDEPTAIALARHVREALDLSGVRLVPLPDMTFD